MAVRHYFLKIKDFYVRWFFLFGQKEKQNIFIDKINNDLLHVVGNKTYRRPSIWLAVRQALLVSNGGQPSIEEFFLCFYVFCFVNFATMLPAMHC